MRRTAVVVDVHAVRLAVDEVTEAAEAAKELRCRRGRRAVRAIDQHAQAGQVSFDRAS